MVREVSPLRPPCILGIFTMHTAAMLAKKTAASPPLGMDCVTPSSAEAAKSPCEVKGSELKFVVLGDWGGKSTRKNDANVNSDVAKTIIDLAEKRGLHFVLNVGDNFYPFFSASKTADEQFDGGFLSMFPEKKINLPFYSMLGNHDYVNLSGIQKQIGYTENPKSTGRWILPERYYTMNFKLSESGKLVRFIMVDTQLLCGALITGTNGEWRPTGRQQMTPRDLQESIAHEKWLLGEIWKAHNVHYLFVVGHYHVHTVRSSVPDVECMHWVLSDKMLAKQRVTAYISGHEHLLQHWEFASDSGAIHHVLSGEGYSIQPITVEDVDMYKKEQSAKFFHGRVQHPRAPTPQFNDVKANKPGVVVVSVGATQASIEYTDDAKADKPLYSFNVPFRETHEKPQDDEPKLGEPFAFFKRQITVKGSRCSTQWAMRSSGKNSLLVDHAVAGNVGCIQQHAAASHFTSGIYRAGGNRIHLLAGGKKPKPALPIWACFRCDGKDEDQQLVLAFCHVGDDLNTNDGYIAYDRFVIQDSVRYMCNGATVMCYNNKGKCRVVAAGPEGTKETITEMSKPEDQFKPEDFVYTLSDDAA